MTPESDVSFWLPLKTRGSRTSACSGHCILLTCSQSLCSRSLRIGFELQAPRHAGTRSRRAHAARVSLSSLQALPAARRGAGRKKTTLRGRQGDRRVRRASRRCGRAKWTRSAPARGECVMRLGCYRCRAPRSGLTRPRHGQRALAVSRCGASVVTQCVRDDPGKLGGRQRVCAGDCIACAVPRGEALAR